MDPKPCIVVHHGGNWRMIPEMTYVGGSISIYDDLPDDINAFKIKEIISSLGYDNITKTHFLDPKKNMDTGLRILVDHMSFDSLISFLGKYGIVHLFCEHDSEVGFNRELDTNISFMSLLNGEQETGQGIIEQQNNNESSELHIHLGNITSLENLGNDITDYDEEASDNDDEEVVYARLNIEQEKLSQKEFDEDMGKLKRLADRSSLEKIDVNSDSEISDDLESPNESSDEDDCGYLETPPSRVKRRRGVNLSNQPGLTQDPVFLVGDEFDNAVQFKKAITNYCVHYGKSIKYYKNHKDRVGAKCKADGCTWKIWASWGGQKRTFQVKSITGHHVCGRGKNVKNLTATWISENYHSKFKVNPYMRLQEIVDTIWSERGIEVSIFTAHKARKKAQQLILGEYMEQYGLLHRYAMEILRSNPENTVKFHLENGVFKRIYVCFCALRKGFLSGCRPFISLDGCFLKGPYGGQLLVAVGRDGNNQMFPIAWAVVEVENYECWKWFLILLADDLNTTHGSGYTIMSDQQKGLIKAVIEVWAQAEHRCCARHVYCNFREVFGGGQEYRRAFWRLAKSTTENEFIEKILEFSDISVEAAENILNRNYKKWCRAFFSPESQCDNVDNNMSEVFNAYIIKPRHKPPITMLEDIRESLMERMHKKRDFIANKDISICPRIQERLEKSKFGARGWLAFWDGKFCFGVREGATQTKFVVNLSARTCSCNAWQLSGVPCNHAVAAIWKNGHHPEDYVADCYRRATYLKAYAHCLEPLNGPQEWPQTQNDPILPPPLKKLKACRPTTKRRKQAGEVVNKNRMSRAGNGIRCSRCGGSGHNKRKCPSSNEPSSSEILKNQQHELIAPTKMHNKGLGLYTYPNGHQRLGQMMPTMQQRVAVYTDYEGEQTIRSISTQCENSCYPSPQASNTSNNFPWFIDDKGKYRITRQTLEDFAKKRKS